MVNPWCMVGMIACRSIMRNGLCVTLLGNGFDADVAGQGDAHIFGCLAAPLKVMFTSMLPYGPPTYSIVLSIRRLNTTRDVGHD